MAFALFLADDGHETLLMRIEEDIKVMVCRHAHNRLPECIASPPLVTILGNLHTVFKDCVHFQAALDAGMTPAIGQKLP